MLRGQQRYAKYEKRRRLASGIAYYDSSWYAWHFNQRKVRMLRGRRRLRSGADDVVLCHFEGRGVTPTAVSAATARAYTRRRKSRERGGRQARAAAGRGGIRSWLSPGMYKRVAACRGSEHGILRHHVAVYRMLALSARKKQHLAAAHHGWHEMSAPISIF